jgi:FKBP-type peptidyl-prolyl cis-trans isomerase FklB
MRKLFLAVTLLLANLTTQAQTPLKSTLDSVAYSIGINIGQSFKAQGINNLDLQLVMKGIDDYVKSNKTSLSVEQCNMFLGTYFQKEKAQKSAAARKGGYEFLQKNKTQAGVQTTASGLQYQVLTAGTGAKPLSTEKVKVHYHGTLIDGTVFDSSVQRGEPVTFGVTQVIPGWVEALQMMPTGSKWKVFIPADLAYGDNPAGQIPPGSALIFEIELLAIEK